MMDKKVEDTVISPFQTVRNQPYMVNNKFYSENKVLQEQPIDIYISSSWYDDDTCWMWDIMDSTVEDIVKGKTTSTFLAFDESLALLHHLKTLEQLIKEKRKQDADSWKLEFLNLRIKNSVSSYFTYSMLTKAQTLTHVFYPRNNLIDKRNKYSIPKLDNEIRVVSCDIAFVSGEQNDNSVYTCLRGIPISENYVNDNNVIEVKTGYHRQIPYLESNQMGDTQKQAVRIRQLYEDFQADYIVVDARNGGSSIIFALQKPLYDEERGIEYPPLKCMNNDDYSKTCMDVSAKECIFAINATQALNSDIAINFRRNLIENKISMLINYNKAKEEILDKNPDYVNELDVDAQVFYENPFLQTQKLISECAALEYERMPQTNTIKIRERGSNRKDRYTSASYGSYFLDLKEQEDLSGYGDYEFGVFIN